MVTNGDRAVSNGRLGKVSQKLCLPPQADKSEKSVIISTVFVSVTIRSGKPHLVQGMRGGMDMVMARYPIPAAA